MNNMQGFVDCHTHILPGMDDGPATVNESIEMVETLCSQGVNAIWLTPHFYPFKESIDSFLDRRDKSLSRFIQNFSIPNVNLIVASETYFSDYIFNISDITPLCIGNSKYILTELPFASSFAQRTFDRIGRFISNYGVVPIFAHIERYPKLLKHVAYVDELIDMGCLMQINLSALGESFFQQRKLLTYIERNLVHVVGTDCHNLESRPPHYLHGISIIEKKLGIDYVEQLMENTRRIVNDGKKLKHEGYE